MTFHSCLVWQRINPRRDTTRWKIEREGGRKTERRGEKERVRTENLTFFRGVPRIPKRALTRLISSPGRGLNFARFKPGRSCQKGPPTQRERARQRVHMDPSNRNFLTRWLQLTTEIRCGSYCLCSLSAWEMKMLVILVLSNSLSLTKKRKVFLRKLCAHSVL